MGGHGKEGDSIEAVADHCGEWETQWASYQRARSIRVLRQRGLCVHVILHLLFWELQFWNCIYKREAMVLNLGVRTPNGIAQCVELVTGDF